MLYEFITANRERIISLARARVHERGPEGGTDAALEHGVPVFLGQLAQRLKLLSSTEASAASATKTITDTAALHGHDLLKSGFSVAQVVHGYGDVCQVVTELASQTDASIRPEEFQVFNRCLDDAIAGAVTAYGRQRERDIALSGSERLGFLAHELRNLLNTAILSFDVLRKGVVGVGGSTGAIHARSLSGLRILVERSLAQVRLDARAPDVERLSLREFMEEVQVSATLQAEASERFLCVRCADEDVFIDADRQLLASATQNLLQNAFKFSPVRSTVSFTSRVEGGRVLIDVADQCGGLAKGGGEDLFRPFEQANADRSGIGLGLTIARQAVAANSGEIHVRDIPGVGCVFTIDLPFTPSSQMPSE